MIQNHNDITISTCIHISSQRKDYMEKYIEGNKAAWEEAFDMRDASWGADITEKIQKEDYLRKVMKNLILTIGRNVIFPILSMNELEIQGCTI